MIPWKKYDDEHQPKDGQFCLVCFRDGDMDVRYFVREKPGFCWGWYPGGSDPIGAYWVPIDEVPLPGAGGVQACLDESAKLRMVLAEVAEVAHAGGLRFYSMADCLSEIRRLTVGYWDKAAKDGR